MKKAKNIALSVVCLVLIAGIAAGLYFSTKEDSLKTDANAGKTVTATDDTGFVTAANVKEAILEKVKERTEAEGEKKETEDTAAEEKKEDFSFDGIRNILLIGVDNDNIEGLDKLGNADGIMLVTLNNSLKQLTLTSIMRDTKIRQPREYEKKITSIYHAGGTPLLIEAIEQNFGVYIDQYILVNYLNVIDIVDALGGLDVELSADEIDLMAGKISNLEQLTGAVPGTNALSREQTGLQHLNGLQISAYLRVRPGSTDYDSGRTERARNVVLMILKKLNALSTSEKAAFVDKFMPAVETDMSDTDLLNFAMNSSAFDNYEVFSAKIPLDGTYTTSTDGNSFVIPDLEANNKYLYKSIYEGKH